ncbi:hypothetical protein M6G53_00570 [Serratia nevei]|uniref:hypothetical protein n=1 Tax=Serratia nevei TaxID=2703794 RepID=UPI0020A01B4A|nr:hypothetical protein [Serratia nevei]MCP1103889.1 hypothetical protein [Serratia nevei]
MTSLSPRDIEARYRFAREIARAAADLAFSFYQRRQSLAVDFKQGLRRGNPLLLANAALYPQLAELIHMPGLIGSTCPIARVMAG